MGCPVCKSNSYKPFPLNKNKYLALSCNSCGHLYCGDCPPNNLVASIFSDDYFEHGEAGYPNYIENEPLIVERGHYYSGIVKKLSAPGYMLDIGCAAGFLLKGFRDNGWKVQGVEPNSKMANYGRLKFDLDIEVSDFESYTSEKKFDLITMIQVVAHFYDVRTCVYRASQFLKPHGLLLFETWNKNSLTAKMLGKAWHEYSPPSVKNWFTPLTLKKLVEQHGMKRIKSSRTIKKISKRHAVALLKYKYKNSAVFRILEKILKIIPEKAELVYPGDDLFWMIFRKS